MITTVFAVAGLSSPFWAGGALVFYVWRKEWRHQDDGNGGDQ